MPIYEYRCEVCGSQFERRQGFDDPPASECPEGHSDVRRVFSPAGIIFKGSGFYVTDNRETPAGKNGNGTSKAATESSESKSETTSASKSETTTE